MITGFANLNVTLTKVYDENDFAHLNIQTLPGVYLPEDDVFELADQLQTQYPDQIQAIQPRLIIDTGFQVFSPEAEGNVSMSGRVISWSGANNALPAVNSFELLEGSKFSELNQAEILVESHFYQFWNLSQGSSVYISDGSNFNEYFVAGEVFSPEFVWPTKSLSEFSISARTFGVVFLDLNSTQSLFQLEGQLNEISIQMFDTPSVGDMMVLALDIQKILEDQFGSIFLPIQTRDLQPSNALWEQEMTHYTELGLLLPSILLIIGAAGIYISVARVIKAQRQQIGIIQSLGYDARNLIIHYLEYAGLIGILGAILGTAIGLFYAYFVSRVYITVFGLPDKGFAIAFDAVALGLLIGIFTSLLAGILPLTSLLREHPANSINDDAGLSEERARPSLIEKLFRFWSFRTTTIIPLRNAFRNRRRSVSTVLGILVSVAVLVTGLGLLDGARWGIQTQFSEEQMPFEFRIIYSGVKIEIDLQLLESLATEFTAEDLRILNQFNLTKDTTYINSRGFNVEQTLMLPIQLFSPDSSDFSLLQSYNTNEESIIQPVIVQSQTLEDGILLTRTQMRNLGVSIGDEIKLLIPEIDISSLQESDIAFSFKNKSLKVAGEIYNVNSRISAISNQQLVKLLFPPVFQLFIQNPEDITISNVLYLTSQSNQELSKSDINSIRQEFFELGQIQTIDTPEEISQDFLQFIGLMDIMTLIFGSAAWTIALALIYNTIGANLTERRREIATIRTIGLGDRQIIWMITFENFITSGLGIILGIPIGFAILTWLIEKFSGIMQIPVLLSGTSWLIITFGVIIVVLLSELPGLRSVFNLNLAEETKSRM